MYVFVPAWVIVLEYQFYVKKWAADHILFNKFQFIDQIAIKNVRQLVLYVFMFSKAIFKNIALSYCPWLSIFDWKKVPKFAL